MSLSTHVLDAAEGGPVRGMTVRLDRRDGDGWATVAERRTDDDGRIRDLPDPDTGTYRLVFHTAGHSDFYPEVSVAFAVTAPEEHYHVPLLLSPFAYSTYRGS